MTETKLATEKQAILDLKTALQKAKEEVQLAKEAAEAEKRASLEWRRRKRGLPRNCQKYTGITVAFHELRLLMLQVSL